MTVGRPAEIDAGIHPTLGAAGGPLRENKVRAPPGDPGWHTRSVPRGNLNNSFDALPVDCKPPVPWWYCLSRPVTSRCRRGRGRQNAPFSGPRRPELFCTFHITWFVKSGRHKNSKIDAHPPKNWWSLFFCVYRLACGPLNNKTPAVATDRLLCVPPCVCTDFCVYRLSCGLLNNKTPAVATDRLLCVPPFVCSALCVHRLLCVPPCLWPLK